MKKLADYTIFFVKTSKFANICKPLLERHSCQFVKNSCFFNRLPLDKI